MMSRRTTLILAILVVSAGMGAFEAYLAHNHVDLRIATVVSLFLFAVLLFSWCKADAAHRHIVPPPAAALLVGIFALVGIPYYFFRAFPAGRAAIYSACAFAIFLFSMFLTVATYWITLRAYAI